MNFIKEVRIKVQTSERSQPSPDGLMSQAERSIGQDLSTPADHIDRMERITSPLMNGSPSQQIAPTLQPHLSTSPVYVSLDRISRDAILPLIERQISRDPSEVIRQLMERRPQDRIAIVKGISKFFQGLKSYRSYEMTGLIKDLENALQNMRQGADMIPISRGDSSPLAILSPMVGLVIFLHCKKTNQMDGLHEAIQRMQNIGITEPGDEAEIGPSLSLNMSAMAFQLMFGQSRDLDHLHESIRRAQKGVDALSPQSPLFLIGSSLLGCLLVLRFEETNEVEDLDKAISLLRLAKDHALPQYRNQLPLLMTVLGGALYHRFKRTGSAADLDQGIHYTQKAVEGPGSCQDLALHLQNLGELLECRFDRDNRLDDIHEAIRRTKQASNIVIARGAADSTLLNNLSTKFIALHKRTKMWRI
ncbi:CHAT domain-containing protein [Penicillium malachiteum]|nr:CHAT domain-containing protein [Penicillium malachiteum]